MRYASFISTRILFSKLSSFFEKDTALHKARFARLHELAPLLAEDITGTSLLLGISDLGRPLLVKQTPTRRELGNVLVCGPTRSGKTIYQESELLAWPHSVVVNDIKGELFEQTAGYRATLGPVFVLDPSTSVGHRFDPLQGNTSERQLYRLAYHLLHDPKDRETVFAERATKMLTQVFLAARLILLCQKHALYERA